MKKAYLFLLCAAIVLGLATQAFCGTNILLNPGFGTTNEFGNIDQWNMLNGDVDSLAQDFAVFRVGPASAKMTIWELPAGGIDFYTNLCQDVDYAAGVPLNASVYVKPTMNPMSNVRAGMRIAFLNSAGLEISNTALDIKTGGTSSWRLLRVSIPATPAGTVKVRFALYTWAKNTDTLSVGAKANFDDAYLAQEYKAVPLGTVLLNGSFENGVIDWTEATYPSLVTNTVFKVGKLALQKKIVALTNAANQPIDFYSDSSQEIKCLRGKKVVATAYIRTQFVKPNTVAAFRVYCLNASNVILGRYTQYVYGTKNWAAKTITIPSTPTGTVKLRYVLYVWGKPGEDVGKSAFFDGCTLAITTPTL